MTEVFMGYECTLKVGTDGVNSADEKMLEISDLTSVEYSTSTEKDEWYAFRNKGKKTSIITSREDTLDITFKAVKNDPAGRYLVKTAMMNTGSDAMTKISCVIPLGFKIEGPVALEVSNPGTGEGNKVPDVNIKAIFSGDYTITDTLADIEGA